MVFHVKQTYHLYDIWFEQAKWLITSSTQHHNYGFYPPVQNHLNSMSEEPIYKLPYGVVHFKLTHPISTLFIKVGI